MTTPDPILDYATAPPTANPRWGLRIAAGLMGALLLFPAVVFSLFAMGCMISTFVELAATNRSFASIADYVSGFVFFASVGVLIGGTSTWLIGFAQHNSLRTRKSKRVQ